MFDLVLVLSVIAVLSPHADLQYSLPVLSMVLAKTVRMNSQQIVRTEQGHLLLAYVDRDITFIIT
jgi:hypothetical protein